MIHSILPKKLLEIVQDEEQALKTTTGVLVPDLLGNRFLNHGVSANLPSVEIVALHDYTHKEKNIVEEALNNSKPKDKKKIKIRKTADTLLKMDNEQQRLSNLEGVTYIPPFRPRQQENPELETPSPPQEMDALTLTQNPSILGTRSREDEAPSARRTRSRHNPDNPRIRTREEESTPARRRRIRTR